MSLDFWTSLGYSTTILDYFNSSSVSGATVTINATGGRTGGPSLRFVNSAPTTSRVIGSLLTSGATRWHPCAYRTTQLPLSDRVIFELRESNAVQVDVRITSDGKLRVTRAGTTLGTSTAQIVFPNVYFQFEIKAFINDTTGTIDVRLSGDVAGIPGLVGLTGLDTKATSNALIDAVAYCFIEGGSPVVSTTDFCHFWVRNDDWSGDIRIDYLPNNVAGFHSDFIPSTGANETTIDEIGSPTADYNASQVVGDKDSFTGGSISATATVIGVSPVMRHNKQDAGAAQDMFLFRQGGVDYTTGAAFNPPFGSDQYVKEMYLLNPATAAAFTPTEINGTLERGYTRSA